MAKISAAWPALCTFSMAVHQLAAGRHPTPHQPAIDSPLRPPFWNGYPLPGAYFEYSRRSTCTALNEAIAYPATRCGTMTIGLSPKAWSNV